jgi:hypothetical protein
MQRSLLAVGMLQIVGHFSLQVFVKLKANHRVLVEVEEDDRKHSGGYSEEDYHWMKKR